MTIQKTGRCRPGLKSFGKTCVKAFQKAIAVVFIPGFNEGLSRAAKVLQNRSQAK